MMYLQKRIGSEELVSIILQAAALFIAAGKVLQGLIQLLHLI